jgi:hypothetical protein
MIKDDYVLKRKYDERVAEGEAWWARYVAEMNAYNEGKVAIGCALDPDKPLTSERRYVD